MWSTLGFSIASFSKMSAKTIMNIAVALIALHLSSACTSSTQFASMPNYFAASSDSSVSSRSSESTFGSFMLPCANSITVCSTVRTAIFKLQRRRGPVGDLVGSNFVTGGVVGCCCLRSKHGRRRFWSQHRHQQDRQACFRGF